jgi:hypothetical protein
LAYAPIEREIVGSIPTTTSNNLKQMVMDEIKAIHPILQEAKKYGLETEVIWSALNSLKNNPTQTIVEAMENGMNEWIK